MIEKAYRIFSITTLLVSSASLAVFLF